MKMASPLTFKTDAALNTPNGVLGQHSTMDHENDTIMSGTDNEHSSPFVAAPDHENEVLSHNRQDALSPTLTMRSDPSLKELKIRAGADEATQRKERNLRRLSSPASRFPVKVASMAEPRASPVKEESRSSTPTSSRSNNTPTIRENEGLTKAIQIMEDDYSEINYDDTEADFNGPNTQAGEDEDFADNTAFSTFSAVPDMTMFAKIGHTPTKFASQGGHTSNLKSSYIPATLRRPNTFQAISGTPTPRRTQVSSSEPDTATNLLDFTEQFNKFSTSRRGRETPTQEHYGGGHGYSNSYAPSSARTPSPNKRRPQSVSQNTATRMSNLLDFDIPPAPTPRSMPSVTPREVESMKSKLLSEISSLRASLLGKEAEVSSLKNAIGDAEKRVQESENIEREEREMRQQLEAEKESWIKRSHEMEMILRNVKEEIVHSERERESLEGRLDESEKRREAAEMMAQEAESKMAAMRASHGAGDASLEGPRSPGAANGREVELAVEKVARELHALYKGKHETKVAALKKSYEGRWDRKVKDLEAHIEELKRENETIREGRNNDAQMSDNAPQLDPETVEELRARTAQAAEVEARLEGFAQELQSIKSDNDNLRSELEQERVEKGELVAACDELLALQETSAQQPPQQVESLRASVGRPAPSGLRMPTSTTSRIGGIPKPGQRSGSAQGMNQNRPGSGLGGMRYGGRGE